METIKIIFTGSLPIAASGSFGDGKGTNIPTGVAGNYYENITATNIQGLTAADRILILFLY
jgi:hypothetical protein